MKYTVAEKLIRYVLVAIALGTVVAHLIVGRSTDWLVWVCLAATALMALSQATADAVGHH